LGSELVDTVRTAYTVIDKGWNVMPFAPSRSLTVKPEVPIAVGAPEIRPVVEFRVKPGGNAPALIDQL
jgi:hypothetical protein